MRTLAALACLLTLALAGCSGGTDDEDGGVTVQPGTSTTAATGAGSTSAGTTSSAAAADYDVELYDSRYDPTTLSVPNFQKVVFTNKGTLSHTVTIVKQGDPPGTFLRDQPLQPNGALDYNFPNDGTYNVYCRYHGTETSGMHMTITV